MADSQAFQHDPVERFLDTRFPTTTNAQLRQTLLARTMRVLHRRRRLKQASFVAALAGCYLLGLGTMQFWRGAPPSRIDTVHVSPHHQTAESTPASESAQAARPAGEDLEAPAFVLERMAQSYEQNRSHLYRRAGDRYLADGDLRSAVHCYGRSLDAGTEKDWAVSKDDNWLLIHLKSARQEEKLYAKSTG